MTLNSKLNILPKLITTNYCFLSCWGEDSYW